MTGISRAVILGAGRGARFSRAAAVPKVLLKVGGQTLLARHLDNLSMIGLVEIAVVAGFRIDLVEAEAGKLADARPGLSISLIDNPSHDLKSASSLGRAAGFVRGADDVWVLDGDVLYPKDVLERMRAAGRDVLPFDRNFVPGDEPVKLVAREGRVVDLGKDVRSDAGGAGEWLGFARLSRDRAAMLLEAITRAYAQGADGNYEDILRLEIRSGRMPRLTALDVTGLPWTEIDFTADLERARSTVWPEIKRLEME